MEQGRGGQGREEREGHNGAQSSLEARAKPVLDVLENEVSRFMKVASSVRKLDCQMLDSRTDGNTLDGHEALMDTLGLGPCWATVPNLLPADMNKTLQEVDQSHHDCGIMMPPTMIITPCLKVFDTEFKANSPQWQSMVSPHSLNHYLTHSLSQSLTHSLSHSVTHSLCHSLSHSLRH